MADNDNVNEDYDIIAIENDDGILVVVEGGGSINFSSNISDKDLLERTQGLWWSTKLSNANEKLVH